MPETFPATAEEHADRLAEIVEAALELAPEERVAFVEGTCGAEPELRAEVDSLLKFQAQATGFIEVPAYQLAAATLVDEESALSPGQMLGEYKIRSLLGEGGMGEVYLAEDTALGRTVAIKLVKRGFGRANFLRQFRQEERILAGLTHPHIARLYGGAVTADGLPYFVMEYVEGDPLDTYCALHRLGLRARLEMFCKICSAVSYAHQHLVIHRDLKPANIRVTIEGDPKLLDFGIARLIDEHEGAAGETISVPGLMTPDYASPEQVRGERMTTASDVYSLGVILYELLSGEKPYRLTSRRAEEISRAITETEPPRPSTAARQQGAELTNRKSLRGDLDNIVLMAMRKEPERRYGSVAQFAGDIGRYLEGRPVVARHDTWTYRSAKFVRRHKVAVAAAALVLASLLGGILTTSWEASRAEKARALAQGRFEDVRRLAHSLMFEIHDSVADLPGSTPTRKLIVSRALEYLNNLARDAGDDPSLARELASAYVKVGNVQGNPNNSNLGDTTGALESFEKAKHLTEALLARHPGDAQARRQLGVVEEKMSDVQAAMGDLPAAVANAQRSLAAFQSFAESDPSVAAQQSLAISSFKTGDVLGNPNFPNNGDKAGALEHYQRALRILQKLPAAEGDDFKTPRLIGLVEERLGTMFEVAENIPAAREHYAASRTIRLRLAEAHPENTDVLRDAAIADEKMANIMTASGDLQAALEHRQRSLEIFARLAEADPKNALAHRSLAISYEHLGDLLGNPKGPNLGRIPEAIAAYHRAEQILTGLSDAADTRTRESLQEVRAALALIETTR
ncbi:MAG: protein kinase [Verrucomicrobiota bacterium]|nr:protein kinase [Verrucomicrobiota bacterium]